MSSDSLVGSAELAMSKVSLHSNGSQSEDWDRSLTMDESPSSSQSTEPKTPRNSVAFPGDGKDGVEATPSASAGKGNRSLSELMKLHAEKGTDCTFTTEEAARVAEVLGRWINASSSPYEDDDDFFSKDDLSLNSSTRPASTDGRPRGQSESVARKP